MANAARQPINLKEVLHEISSLQLEYHENRTKFFDNVIIDQRILNDIISENALLLKKISELEKESREFSEKIKIKEKKRERKKEEEKKLVSLPNRIVSTFHYVEINEDGTKNPFTIQELELNNFQILFRYFLESLVCPSLENLEPVINWKLRPIGQGHVGHISGPEDSSAANGQTFGLLASARTVSNYPHCQGRPYREGDPICDRYQMKLMENSVIICVTDGCNWGDKPRRAARVANKTIVQYVHNNIRQAKTVADVVNTLLASLVDAQLAIIHLEDYLLAGATTAVVGAMLEVDQEWVESHVIEELGVIEDFNKSLAPTRWVFVCVNVGDCKVLHYSKRTRCVTDITFVSRSNHLDPTDPGGRLGPFQEMYPDLRNLAAFWQPVEEGDIIMAMSDGVHDNLDPQIQGLDPRDFELKYNSWDSVPQTLLYHLKQRYLVRFVEDLIGNMPLVTPAFLQHRIIEYCINISSVAREYLRNNPTQKTPSDYKTFPGKLDHTTIACFRVGYMSEAGRTQFPPQHESTHIVLQKSQPVAGRVGRSGTVSRPPTVISQVKSDLQKLKNLKLDPIVVPTIQPEERNRFPTVSSVVSPRQHTQTAAPSPFSSFTPSLSQPNLKNQHAAPLAASPSNYPPANLQHTQSYAVLNSQQSGPNNQYISAHHTPSYPPHPTPNFPTGTSNAANTSGGLRNINPKKRLKEMASPLRSHAQQMLKGKQKFTDLP